MTKILKFFQNVDNAITYLFSNLSKEDLYLKKKFKKKSIILVDVGSNLGGYVDLVKSNLSIKHAHMFEPSNKCNEELSKKYNKDKFFINNMALSNKNKVKKFYESEILSQSSLHKNKNKFNSSLQFRDIYKINCTTLDSYFLKLKKNFKIDILKIDTEGEDLKIQKKAI